MSFKRKNIILDQIHTDGGTQVRESINREKVLEYAELMKDGTAFENVVVFEDKNKAYWLADGFHRVSAAREAGLKEIQANVYKGTVRDAELYARGANGTHGMPLTNKEKRSNVEQMLRDEEWSRWSDRKIADHCHVSHPFVGKIREELSGNGFQMPAEREYTRGGKTHKQKLKAKKPKAKAQKPAAPEPEEVEPRIYEPEETPAPEAEAFDWFREAEVIYRLLTNRRDRLPESERPHFTEFVRRQLLRMDADLAPYVEPEPTPEVQANGRQKQCEVCGAAFEAKRADASTCSGKCRKRKFRERKGAKQ